MPAFKAEEQNQLQIAEREEIGAIEKLTSHGINAGDVKKLQDAGIYTSDANKMPASTFSVQSPPPTNPTFWQQVGKVVEHAVKQGAEDAVELYKIYEKGKEMEEKEKKRQEQLKNKPLAPAVLKKPPTLAPPEVKKPPTLSPAPAKVADDQAPANKAAPAAPAGLLFPSSMGSTIDETGPSGSA